MNKFVPDFPDSWMIVPVTIVGPPRDKEDVTLEPWGVIWDKAQGSYNKISFHHTFGVISLNSLNSWKPVISKWLESPKLGHTKAEIGVQNHALKAYGGIY